ncbi:hypothetical protein ACLKA7_001784 [Drosophila subpalustris]
MDDPLVGDNHGIPNDCAITGYDNGQEPGPNRNDKHQYQTPRMTLSVARLPESRSAGPDPVNTMAGTPTNQKATAEELMFNPFKGSGKVARSPSSTPQMNRAAAGKTAHPSHLEAGPRAYEIKTLLPRARRQHRYLEKAVSTP